MLCRSTCYYYSIKLSAAIGRREVGRKDLCYFIVDSPHRPFGLEQAKNWLISQAFETCWCHAMSKFSLCH